MKLGKTPWIGNVVKISAQSHQNYEFFIKSKFLGQYNFSLLSLYESKLHNHDQHSFHTYVKYLVVSKLSTKMGSFVGHAVPGTFFTLAGLWWTVNIFWRYFSVYFNQLHHGAKKDGAYKNTVSFSCDTFCQKRYV